KGVWPNRVEDEGRAFQWSLWARTELEEPVLTAVMHRMSLPADQRDPNRADDAALQDAVRRPERRARREGVPPRRRVHGRRPERRVGDLVGAARRSRSRAGAARAGLGCALYGAAGVRARAAARLSRPQERRSAGRYAPRVIA